MPPISDPVAFELFKNALIAIADELHARLVAQGVARRAPEDPLELYFCQCAYVSIAAKRRLPGGPDEALAAVTAEVAELTGGLPMPMFR